MLIACKVEINYSKRASSMLEFAVIEEDGEVHATMKPVTAKQSGRVKGD
jgi:hypothetical protein